MSLEMPRATAVLWGKSDAGGKANLLLQHLLDTAAVAELLWDRYLAASVKQQLDSGCAGDGRGFFALLCGLHDVGKATPAFQCKVETLAQPVRDVGLSWRGLDRESKRWHHSSAGAVIVRSVLLRAGWSDEAAAWVWPLIAGHHGLVPPSGIFRTAKRLAEAQGRGLAWTSAQEGLVRAVAEALDVRLSEMVPTRPPRRGVQLALSGAVIMADWIASGEHFPGIANVEDVSMAVARDRARGAWRALELHGGWGADPYQPVADLVVARFGRPARPLQATAVALAERMTVPGLMIVEAPMGEGKTEAALVAAEVLGRRFGCDGVFVGMPTQATSDPMFERVLAWAQAVQQGLPVGLLHGKRMFNRKWNELQKRRYFAGVDEFGCDDEHDISGMGRSARAEQAPAEWFLGPKRGMLMPVTVGTIDNLLHAGTRTKHVMLRHAGLAGRVVILDEVHAYDTYMSQFLFEALRWLADAGVPVILLSATLPPDQRNALARAYMQGALSKRNVDVALPDSVDGYPVLHAVGPGDGLPTALVSASWRGSSRVAVRVLDEAPTDGPDAVVKLVAERLVDGGCTLVIRNTVGRAQQTYTALRQQFVDDEVVLLHSRLVMKDRAVRTQRVLDLLGAPGARGTRRPHRLVVVATQIAEQSFDVDADLLVTDLAPIDLLLQRIGRVHRHGRPYQDRPARVRQPAVVVTGLKTHLTGPPGFVRGSEHVYGRYVLLRAAALVLDAAQGDGWDVPAAVPGLVRSGYGTADIVPDSWLESEKRARDEWEDSKRRRKAAAEEFLLAGEASLGAPTLAGLHDRATGELADDDAVAAVVRDGPETVEVVLVRHVNGRFRTLDGRDMGPNGDGVSASEVAEVVVGSTLRLPPRRAITAAAKADLRRLDGWTDNAWLHHSRALILDENSASMLGGRRLTYDHDLGLLDEVAR